MKKMNTVFSAFCAALSALSFTSCLMKQEPKPEERLVTVSSSGEVKVENDRASVCFTVISRNNDAIRAMDENNRKMTAVTNALEEKGIHKQNIATDSYSIYQESNYVNGRTVQGAFVVSNSITVTINDALKTGPVIDAAVKNGATQLSSLSYYPSSTEESLKEARILAVKNAEKKANTLVSASGAKLGEIVSITETNGNGGVVYAKMMNNRNVLEEAATGDALSTPGKSVVRVSITATYKIE
ncbi:MAG: SIMPL domain-containing protein [Treponema sp.]|nr:SIMPL domain-containing protein [Treponema sp.]